VGRRWTWVAWSMLAVFIVSMVFWIILGVANGGFVLYGPVAMPLAYTAFMVVGALIVAHRPGNAILSSTPRHSGPPHPEIGARSPGHGKDPVFRRSDGRLAGVVTSSVSESPGGWRQPAADEGVRR
jgi:hypothetical protein